MTHINILAFAIPLFSGLMLAEYYISKKKGMQVHEIAESIANVNVGIAERLCDLLTTGSFFYLFTWLYTHAAIFHIQPNWYTWLILFLATDFVWYWYHRLGHEVNLFWSVHVVHHQSEDFNFTVSARITVFQSIARGLFWSILPIIGFPAPMILFFLLLHGAYPFFTHTQLIGRLGWLEHIVVTPSIHRVHHSSNPQYLDKNYGDVLIIWDKLFGTFAEETVAPEYGLTKPLKSYSFLWQHFHFMLEMIVAFKNASGISNKLKVIFGKPNNINPAIRDLLEEKLSSKDDTTSHSLVLMHFIKIQTIITLAVLFFTILFVYYFSNIQLVILSLFIILSVINTGAMLEQKQWVFHIDYARLCLLSGLYFTYYPFMINGVLIALLLTSILGYYKQLNQHYYAYLYRLN